MPDDLRCVSLGFDSRVNKYEKYDVNGYRFHTEYHQKHRPNAKTVNTGVFTKGQDAFDYYGRLQDVYELTFNKLPCHELKLVVFKCHWFDPTAEGQRSTPSIGLVEVRPSTTYAGSDVFVVAHQARQVFYLPYPCQKEGLKGWEVVYQVSPHGKLPMPNEDDYDNINPKTYEGIFYQEQASFGDFGLEGLEDLENVAQTRGETVTDLKDLKMLSDLQEDDSDSDEDEPPLHELPEALYSRDSDSDEDEPESEDEDESEDGY
jgi:hypothetical protein